MPRLLFEKTGNAVWMSHLDLMRLFQRAFKRAGLPLTHTQGFNPRPSVSIALPLSVGVHSYCELLDFDLDGENVSFDEMQIRLNETLIDGVRVRRIYGDGRKIAQLAYLDSVLQLEYDNGVPDTAREYIASLFHRESLLVEKKGKNGVQQQDIIAMVRSVVTEEADPRTLLLRARVCCQNPSLNPMQLATAIEAYLPHCAPDFVKCSRMEIYDREENIFR